MERATTKTVLDRKGHLLRRGRGRLLVWGGLLRLLLVSSIWRDPLHPVQRAEKGIAQPVTACLMLFRYGHLSPQQVPWRLAMLDRFLPLSIDANLMEVVACMCDIHAAI